MIYNSRKRLTNNNQKLHQSENNSNNNSTRNMTFPLSYGFFRV